MPKVPGVIPSAAGVPYHSAKRTRLEYSIFAKTVSYTNAAKNQKNLKIQKNQKKVTYDATVYKEVSTKHFLDNSEPNQLKKMCIGGSDKRIGCSWRQFPDHLNEALDYVTDATGDSCLNETNSFFKIQIYYSGRQIDLYQTVNIDKDITETLNLIGEISDISALAIKNKTQFMPYDMKALFKKNDEKVEIPNLIEVGVAKNLVKNKPNQLQSNGTIKQMQDRINNFLGNSKNQQKNNDWSEVFESLTSNENNIMLNTHIGKHLITQDEAQIAIELESPGNNNGLFTDSDLSSYLSYPSSPVAIDIIELEPNKDISVGKTSIGLIEQLCEQQKNTDIKMDEQ
ncbi:hypothetical protein BB561_002980 [Smittium simulii]|uniref:Uncharacterized protein n=1 Tax=Smittium simulii TaxID=133385 RepID=A0A2T9YNC3_9FUNG|nr:hypothetical protein BB561_002980 [Smittium simulii]